MPGKSEEEPEEGNIDEYEEQVARRIFGEGKGSMLSTPTESRAATADAAARPEDARPVNVVSTSTESRARN
eukprot:10177695-Karenia_brevis.AAC.1